MRLNATGVSLATRSALDTILALPVDQSSPGGKWWCETATGLEIKPETSGTHRTHHH